MIDDAQFLANDWQPTWSIAIASLSFSKAIVSSSVLVYMWKDLENSLYCSDEGLTIPWFILYIYIYLQCQLCYQLESYLIFNIQIAQNQSDFDIPPPLREACILCYNITPTYSTPGRPAWLSSSKAIITSLSWSLFLWQYWGQRIT